VFSTRSVTAVLGAGLLALSACSSSGGGGSNSSNPAPGGSSGSSGPNLSGQSFTVLGQWTGEEQAAFQAVLNKFHDATGASGHYTPAAGGDEAGVLGTQVAGGTPPDIAFLALPGAIQQYVQSGNLKPLTADAQAAVNANYSSEWATLATVKGKLYGVPFDVSNKSTVWYDTNAFQNAGITSDPATWPDFLNAAKTLSASGVSVPVSVGGGDGWTLTDWFENVYIRTAGLDMYDKLTHHQIPWTDPSVGTALTTLKQLWGDHTLIGSPSDALKVTFPSSVDNVFKKKTSAIVFEGSFVASTITGDQDPAVVGQDAKFFPFPSVNGSQPVVVAGGDFAVAFSNSPAVQAFLKFLATPEAAQALVGFKGSGFLSANKNVPASTYPNATLGQLAQQLVSAGNNFRFDMSDQAPSTFGGTPNKGEWADLQAFLQNGDVSGTQHQLEADANKAKGWS
jgi:alpha-glucoside transport system substrate-binding protein